MECIQALKELCNKDECSAKHITDEVIVLLTKSKIPVFKVKIPVFCHTERRIIIKAIGTMEETYPERHVSDIYNERKGELEIHSCL